MVIQLVPVYVIHYTVVTCWGWEECIRNKPMNSIVLTNYPQRLVTGTNKGRFPHTTGLRISDNSVNGYDVGIINPHLLHLRPYGECDDYQL